MKTFFAEKSKVLTLLGAAVLVSSAAFIINSCNKKKSEKEILVEPELSHSAKAENKNKPQPEKEETEPVDDRRTIYLTFDDGPNKGTENLMKIAKKRNVPITAFVVGQHVNGSKKQKDDFKKLQNDSLVELANHSYSHAKNQYSAYYKNPELVVHDFDEATDSLLLKSKIARTPGRNIWRINNVNSTDIKSSTQAANELEKAGYKVIGWDLEWKPDSKMSLKDNHKNMMKKVDSIFFNDLEKTSRHLVFLTHDQYLTDENSVKELDLFIEGLQKTKRFQFKKISEYPHILETIN